MEPDLDQDVIRLTDEGLKLSEVNPDEQILFVDESVARAVAREEAGGMRTELDLAESRESEADEVFAAAAAAAPEVATAKFYRDTDFQGELLKLTKSRPNLPWPPRSCDVPAAVTAKIYKATNFGVLEGDERLTLLMTVKGRRVSAMPNGGRSIRLR
jgi:hypothetical protein